MPLFLSLGKQHVNMRAPSQATTGYFLTVAWLAETHEATVFLIRPSHSLLSSCQKSPLKSRTANQDTCDEYQSSAKCNLNCRRNSGRIHVAVPHPGDRS